MRMGGRLGLPRPEINRELSECVRMGGRLGLPRPEINRGWRGCGAGSWAQAVECRVMHLQDA